MREFLFFQAEYFLVFRKDFLIFLLLADAEDHVMKTFESTNTVNVWYIFLEHQVLETVRCVAAFID